MRHASWPLIALLITDALGIWGIGSRVLEGSITTGIEGAYLACGLFIVQIPLCIVGLSVARKASNRGESLFYFGHMIFSSLLCVVANIDMTTVF
jgi:hypothetical protein